MKILLTGGTGTIGSEILRHCLDHPDITSVVAVTRRKLPETVSGHPKLTSVIMDDFRIWAREILESHSDAVGMIWALGGSEGNPVVNLEFPLAFMNAMAEVLESKDRSAATNTETAAFRFIYLSGALVEKDQNKKLFLERDPPNKDWCVLPAARKLKGVTETESLRFAQEHSRVWQTLIVRPGLVSPKDSIMTPVLGMMFGNNWMIRREELAAFMAEISVKGADERTKTTFENATMVQKGGALLQSRIAQVSVHVASAA